MGPDEQVAPTGNPTRWSNRRLLVIAGVVAAIALIAIAAQAVTKSISCSGYELDSVYWSKLRGHDVVTKKEKEWLIEQAEQLERCGTLDGKKFSPIRIALGTVSGVGSTNFEGQRLRYWEWYLGKLPDYSKSKQDTLMVVFGKDGRAVDTRVVIRSR